MTAKEFMSCLDEAATMFLYEPEQFPQVQREIKDAEDKTEQLLNELSRVVRPERKLDVFMRLPNGKPAETEGLHSMADLKTPAETILSRQKQEVSEAEWYKAMDSLLLMALENWEEKETY